MPTPQYLRINYARQKARSYCINGVSGIPWSAIAATGVMMWSGLYFYVWVNSTTAFVFSMGGSASMGDL